MPAAESISILLPTRGRPALLRRLLDSIAATAEEPHRLEIVLRLDEDDPASHDLDHPLLTVRKLIAPPAKMGAMIRAAYDASGGRYVMFLNDDAVCRTPGWDAALAGALARFPDRVALAWCNDLFRGPAMPNFPMLSRESCEAMGGICPGEYGRDYVDTHLFDIFRKLQALGHDRLVYLPEVVVEHLHFEAGKAHFDPTYAKPRSFADELTYIAWEEQRQLIAEAMARGIRGAAPCAS